MTISELIDKLRSLEKETSHAIPLRVSFYDVDNNCWLELMPQSELLPGVESDQLPGCGCCGGVIFNLRKSLSH